jgi:hypothetical protein
MLAPLIKLALPLNDAYHMPQSSKPGDARRSHTITRLADLAPYKLSTPHLGVSERKHQEIVLKHYAGRLAPVGIISAYSLSAARFLTTVSG